MPAIRTTAAAALVWAVSVAAGFAEAAELSITRTDGGSNVTVLSSNIKVNSRSSLRKEWIVINDPDSPLQIDKETGIETAYDDRRYELVPKGKVKAEDDVSAYRIVFVLFDVFGDRMKSLGSVDVMDMAKGKEYGFSPYGAWYANENDVEELLVSVAYISRVRRKAGGVWEADLQRIQKALDEIGIKVAADQLSVTPKE